MLLVSEVKAFMLRPSRLTFCKNILQGLTLLFAASVSLAAAVKPINVQGSNFVNTATNDRLHIIGVAYVLSVSFAV